MRTLLVFALALAGCSQAPTEKNEVQVPAQETISADHEKIVGRWSLDGNCGADLLTIQPDGTYKSSVESGRWQIEGDNLAITRTASAKREAVPEERRVGTITSVTEDRLTLSYNGEAETWSRCN